MTSTAAENIGAAFAGLSYEKGSLIENPYLFTGSSSNLIALFKLLGPSALRIGGNSVDRNTWTPNGAGQTTGQIAPNDVNALAAFVKATGWQCLYGINLGGAGPNPYTSGSITAATTATLAAEEVAYAASQFGSSLLGIEIGNECDLYGSTYFSGATWNLSTFEALWSQFRAAIVAQAPGVNITGPADAGNESSWTVPFGQWATKSNITLLTQHYYRGNGQSAGSTAANLVTPDSNLLSDLSVLNSGAKAIGELPQNATSATLLEMTQLSAGASGPNLSATSGVTIQSASVGANGSFSAGNPYTLSPNGMQLTCYVPYLSAVLIQTQ